MTDVNALAKRITSGLVALATLTGIAHGSTDPIYIACEITATYDFSTESTTPTTGNASYIIRPQADGSTTYILPWSCIAGTIQTSVSETNYFFSCDQQVGSKIYSRFADIDRVSGEYQEAFSPKGENGLAHIGSCELAKRQF